LVRPRAVLAGAFRIIPAHWPRQEGALRLEDGAAFGTGLHPTTVLCLEALDVEVRTSRPARVLDVGTGSGVLALAALSRGAEHAVAVDVDATAVASTVVNSRINGLASRLHLVRGGPDALAGMWPLVVANILAAPLIEMAPTLARLVSRGGCLVLSGIRSSLAPEVRSAYRRVGMHQRNERSRDGWTALAFLASW
jgi:ribosomal protein L11 methyltransferase